MNFTIKDIENLSGIKAHTIRIWEQRYSFLKPGRTEKNIRSYNDDQLKNILNIALLNRYGYKISHIDKMSENGISDKVISLTSCEAKVDRIINELIGNMVRVDMTEFEQAIDSFIKRHGIERALIQIIFPFLERIGVLWLTNHINPAQEHLVSNIIRQKVIVGIDSVKVASRKNKSICMFLPEGEYHELTLLFITYLLKQNGANIIYLGASVPLHDMEFIVSLKKPAYLFTHLTGISQNFNFERFLKSLSNHFPGVPVIISGKITAIYGNKIPENVFFKRSVQEVMDFVHSI